MEIIEKIILKNIKPETLLKESLVQKDFTGIIGVTMKNIGKM